MPEAKNKATNLIIGTGLLTAETIASELRARLTRYLGNQWRYLTHQELIARARNILAEFEPILAENIYSTDLAAFLAGFDDVAKKLPDFAIDAFGSRMGGPPRPPGGIILPSWYEGDDEPIVEFPLIQKAAENLAQKNILRRYDFDRASQAAKNQAFTAAGDMTEDTLATIRDVLSETVDEGASLEGFRRNLAERIDTSRIGPSHLETVYRTNVQTAFHDGYDALADNPIVAELFPYQAYLAIHDARARPEHIALEKLGIDGTNVYRKEDRAFWDLFMPAWDYNCFLPGTRVEGDFDTGIKSFYHGHAVEIVTKRGHRLSVTANHEVLTNHGFVAAKMLRQRMYAVRHRRQVELPGSAAVNGPIASPYGFPVSASRWFSHEHDAPPLAENVFQSFCESFAADHCKVSPRDLHGDAASGNGYVDVVSTAGQLRNTFKPPGRDSGENVSFAGIDAATKLLSSDSRGLRCLERTSTPPDGIGRFRTGEHRRFPVICPMKCLRFGSASLLHANITKCGGKSVLADPGMLSNFTERHSALVEIDEIVDVRHFEFCGHVFDFQSRSGMVVADGILASNCRCGINLMTIEAAARAGVGEAETWLRTGYRPIMRSRLPYVPFRPPAGFGARRVAA